MENCEFCTEISSFADSVVGRLYSEIENRIVAESENFIIIPTIGQIINYSYLVLPKKHVERFADMETSLLDEFQSLLADFENKMNRTNILFEHGAKCCTGSACGVYHAHVHVVPVISDFQPEDLVGENCTQSLSLKDTLNNLSDTDNYIFYRDNGNVYFSNVENSKNTNLFKSQYFRKWLVSKYEINKDWNWRNIKYEVEVVEALSI